MKLTTSGAPRTSSGVSSPSSTVKGKKLTVTQKQSVTKKKPATKKVTIKKPATQKPAKQKQSKPKKVKEKRSFLYYAMPWNLKKEIGTLGYSFGNAQILMVYGMIVGIMILLGYLFRLPVVWQIPILLAGVLFAPTVVRNIYKNKYEGQRFSDVNVYIEQMLYAFENSHKILTALSDVRELFPKGAMQNIIQEAITLISTSSITEETANVEEQALLLIETRYPKQQVKSLHRFLLKVEQIGGDFSSSTKLLLENRVMWENRMHKLQDKRKKKKQEILGSCACSTLLCMAMLYILPSDVDISSMFAVRLVNVFCVVSMVAIYLKGDTKLCSNLIAPKKERAEEVVTRDYYRFLKYDPRKEFKTSLIFTMAPVLVVLISWFGFHNKWGALVGLILIPLMMTQHMWGHALLHRRLKREITIAFPQWMMELALLLQTENVQVAIFQTVDTALPILKPELQKLREALLERPHDREPFLNFFAAFGLPEITTSMQTLYSLSIGSGGDAQTQIANIVRRNNIILDRAEDMANDDSMASLYTLFLLPVLVGSVVLMTDMTCFLLAFMSNMGV